MSLGLDKFIRPWSHFLTETQQEILQKQLTCAICLGTYKDPVITKCQHIFCKTCLNPVYNTSNTCPLCREKIITITPPNLKVILIIKEALGLGCSDTALDALKTEAEKLQYEQCRTKIQKHIMESSYFYGPWSCELPNDFYENVIFKLRHQLELRGFILHKLINDNNKTYCRIVVNQEKDLPIVKEESDEWDQNFTPQKIAILGKKKRQSLQENIKNSDLSESEKLKKYLQLISDSF